MEKREKRYAIYSKTFPCLIVCSFVAIIWVWVGSSHLNEGVNETQKAMKFFGDISQSISDKLSDMSVSGRRIDDFLAVNACPPYVASYLEDIGESFAQFTNTTAQAARITASVQPAVNNANDSLDKYWAQIQRIAFDLSAALLFVVICVYTLGVCMKTAILMRLGLLLTIVLSFGLCLLVFIEMVIVMGSSDFCMAPTHHIERSLNGFAFDVVHYYSTCQGDGPLFRPIEDSQLYNSLMNATYLDMITDNPLLNPLCTLGAITMEESFREIAASSLNIVEFSRCPYIHKIYSHVMLEGFCGDSYSGFYNVHVSHLATLTLFFALMVNAALLYPHYKGKTLKHLCFCFYSKKALHQDDLDNGMIQSVFLFEDLDYNSDSEYNGEDVETGQVELVMRQPEGVGDTADLSTCFENPAGDLDSGTAFVFVNPAFQGGNAGNHVTPKAAMVRVNAEGGSYVLGDSHEDDVY